MGRSVGAQWEHWSSTGVSKVTLQGYDDQLDKAWGREKVGNMTPRQIVSVSIHKLVKGKKVQSKEVQRSFQVFYF